MGAFAAYHILLTARSIKPPLPTTPRHASRQHSKIHATLRAGRVRVCVNAHNFFALSFAPACERVVVGRTVVVGPCVPSRVSRA